MRRRYALLSAFLVGSVALGASGPRAFGAAPRAGWTGTITFWAQNYTPNSTIAGAPKLTAFAQVAAAYEAAHPGIKIQFAQVNNNDYPQIIRVRAAAGQLWDIWWAQNGDLNGGSIPPGVAQDLSPYFAQKNPYIPGVATWAASMNKQVLAVTQAGNGAHFNIDADYVGTGFYYNKDLFAKAGIAAPPKTWSALLADCAKLKSAGAFCSTGSPDFSWFERHFLSDYYHKQWSQIAAFDHNPAGISALDQAIAIHKGIFSTKDPRFMSWWPVFKQFTSYFDPQYLAQDAQTALQPAEQGFFAGKVAMYYNGSWMGSEIKKAGVRFNYGSFGFPILDKGASTYVSGFNTAAQVGGPNAAYQYALSTPKADKSLADPAKQAAVLDFFHYIGSPNVISKVVDEWGTFVPTWPGTKPAPGTEGIAALASQKLEPVTFTDITPDLYPAVEKIWTQYLSGNLSLQDATTQVQQALDTAVAAYQKTEKVNLSAY